MAILPPLSLPSLNRVFCHKNFAIKFSPLKFCPSNFAAQFAQLIFCHSIESHMLLLLKISCTIFNFSSILQVEIANFELLSELKTKCHFLGLLPYDRPIQSKTGLVKCENQKEAPQNQMDYLSFYLSCFMLVFSC